MNDNTTRLLEQLAAKMGTTTEYLWRVLIKQAPIAASITLIQVLIVIFFALVLYRVHKNLLKKDARGDDGYERYEAGAAVPMALGALIITVFLIASLFCITEIINGYFNPEYWALKEVLDTLSNK